MQAEDQTDIYIFSSSENILQIYEQIKVSFEAVTLSIFGIRRQHVTKEETFSEGC